MRPHHTKTKGDLAVAKAIGDLAEQGFLVLLPLTEHAPFDLVAYHGGRFVRVQVKYRSVVRGPIQVSFQSSWADRHGTHVAATVKASIDVMCIYCPETTACYYLLLQRHERSVALRVSPPMNSQVRKILWAEEHRCLRGVLADADRPPGG